MDSCIKSKTYINKIINFCGKSTINLHKRVVIIKPSLDKPFFIY